jgi:hypothetical protein
MPNRLAVSTGFLADNHVNQAANSQVKRTNFQSTSEAAHNQNMEPTKLRTAVACLELGATARGKLDPIQSCKERKGANDKPRNAT